MNKFITSTLFANPKPLEYKKSAKAQPVFANLPQNPKRATRIPTETKSYPPPQSEFIQAKFLSPDVKKDVL